MGSLDIIYLSSLVNLLLPGTILVFAFLSFVAVISAYKLFTGKLRPQKDLYLLLNNLSCIIFTAIISIQKPVLYYWDEIRLWGPGAKAVKCFNKLYSIGINPTHMDREYPVGNAILNYFFSFFEKDFSEQTLILSYAFLFFAVFAASASLVYKITKSSSVSVAVYFIFLLSPFVIMFHSSSENYSNILYAYGTSLVDMNLPVVFLLVIVLYVCAKRYYRYLLPLIFLVTIKKSGIFFALLAFCIISCFEISNFKDKKYKLKTAAIHIVLSFAVPLSALLLWNIHL